MSQERFTAAPRRLLDTDTAAGRALRECVAPGAGTAEEVRAWERLEARIDGAAAPLGSLRWVYAACATVAVLALLLMSGSPGGGSLATWLTSQEPRLAVTPEPLPPAPPPAEPTPAVTDEQPVDVPPPREPRRLAEPADAGPPAAPEDCLRHARSGEHRRALTCFERQAAGDGMNAELASYELGRLRRNVLGDMAGAIRAYRAYLRRFPGGALRTEAAVSVVELLFASGSYAEALAESERVLSDGTARERAAELRLLRARTYHHRLGDCARAMAEYAQLEGHAGAVGQQARQGRIECERAARAEGGKEPEIDDAGR